MLNRIEEVKKILNEAVRRQWGINFVLDTSPYARKIDELFPQPLDDKKLELKISCFLFAQFPFETRGDILGMPQHLEWCNSIARKLIRRGYCSSQPLEDKELERALKQIIQADRELSGIRLGEFEPFIFYKKDGKETVAQLLALLQPEQAELVGRFLELGWTPPDELQPKIRQERERIAGWLTRKVYADGLLIPHHIVQSIREGSYLGQALSGKGEK